MGYYTCSFWSLGYHLANSCCNGLDGTPVFSERELQILRYLAYSHDLTTNGKAGNSVCSEHWLVVLTVLNFWELVCKWISFLNITCPLILEKKNLFLGMFLFLPQFCGHLPFRLLEVISLALSYNWKDRSKVWNIIIDNNFDVEMKVWCNALIFPSVLQ